MVFFSKHKIMINDISSFSRLLKLTKLEDRVNVRARRDNTSYTCKSVAGSGDCSNATGNKSPKRCITTSFRYALLSNYVQL